MSFIPGLGIVPSGRGTQSRPDPSHPSGVAPAQDVGRHAGAERGQHEAEKAELQARMARLEAQGGEIEFALVHRVCVAGEGRQRDGCARQRFEILGPGRFEQQERRHARARRAGIKARVAENELVARRATGQVEEQMFLVVTAAFEWHLRADAFAFLVQQQRVFPD